MIFFIGYINKAVKKSLIYLLGVHVYKMKKLWTSFLCDFIQDIVLSLCMSFFLDKNKLDCDCKMLFPLMLFPMLVADFFLIFEHLTCLSCFNQDIMFELSDISTCALLLSDISTCGPWFLWASTIKIQHHVLVLYKIDVIIISSKVTCSCYDIAEKLITWLS